MVLNELPDEKLATFLERLRQCQNGVEGDAEADHSNADAILCDVLRAVGLGVVADEWEKVYRWYA